MRDAAADGDITVLSRCGRTVPSSPPTLEVIVEAPPAVPRTGTWPAARLLPAGLALVSFGAVGFMLAAGKVSVHSPMLLMMPVMMLGSAVAAFAGGGRHRAELDAERARYLDYLVDISVQLTEDGAALRNWLVYRHPDPHALWSMVGGAGMWSRRRGDPDFCVARVGLGTVPAATRPTCARGAHPGGRDPVTTTALDRLLRAHGQVSDAPVTVRLAGGETVIVSGEGERVRALVRSVICQLVVSHRPDDLGVSASVGETPRKHWDWLKWLPHHGYSCERTPARRNVVVVDGAATAAPDELSTLVCIEPEAAPAAGLRWHGGEGELIATRPDQLTAVAALAVAQRLAGYRPETGPAGGPADWCGRIGLVDPTHTDPEMLWDNQSTLPLRVPIGTAADGAGVDLDIREAAADGMGPHGLCLGATGSGKSELLRTIALGMVARHSPETLNLVLVDFKGGATFLDFARVRHTTAVITNLEDEAYLVERMRDALGGEIDRRQRLLRTAGNLGDVGAYLRARRADRSMPALPTLFIIVDEFSELLSRHPEFVDVFVAIGRLGRSLGMHLLLASQRLDEGRLRGLESHLSYRICLKTLSEAESRVAIGVPDAYHLPAQPGAAYLKVGAAQPQPFQAVHVAGRLPGGRVRSEAGGVPRLFTAAPADRVDPGPQVTVAETVLAALAGHGPPPHRLWLPPLTAAPALSTLLAGVAGGGLRVPIGLVDNAFAHRRDPLLVDVSGAAGNVAVVGAPQTGKTTAVRTLVTALAATHDPRRTQVYCLDFGGGLADLAALPHVGTVAGRAGGELVLRTVVELLALLRSRESAGTADGDPFGDVFLVVDGWSAARRDHDAVEDAVAVISGSGLSFGMHVVLTASRWADIRPAIRDQIGTRIELRLGDPADSEIDRARARLVPRDRPGHGLGPDGLPMVIARPDDGIRIADNGWRAPEIRLLPELVDYSGLLAADLPPGCVLGIDENWLKPVVFDLTGGHLLVFGEPGSGKTALLRLICHEILRTVPDARLWVIDPRRTLGAFGGDGDSGLSGLVGLVRDPGRTRPVYLVVDDYDLAASASAPLGELIAHARDSGLHLVVARRSGGAARAFYDPVLSGLREAGAAGLQLSGSPDDGPLVGGVRPRPLPPGRGVLVTRAGGEQTIQVAWTEPR